MFCVHPFNHQPPTEKETMSQSPEIAIKVKKEPKARIRENDDECLSESSATSHPFKTFED